MLESRDAHVIHFQCTNRRARECVEALQELGVGYHFGTIDILELKSVLPRLSNHPGGPSWKKSREYSTTNSLTLEEIYESIEKQYHLTFEYLGMCSAASVVCAVGLVTNSDPSVVASMLLSPLMGPILGITLGTACRDWSITIKALRNELIGVFLTLFFGIVTGLIMAAFKSEPWETDQMMMRGTVSGLAPGVLIAVPCGVALAFSVTSADGTILVGVAIAAALLPPIVDAGLEFALGLVLELPHIYEAEHSTKHLEHAAASFILFLLNWVAIYFGCLFVFGIKRVQPRVAQMQGHHGHRRLESKPRMSATGNGQGRPANHVDINSGDGDSNDEGRPLLSVA